VENCPSLLKNRVVVVEDAMGLAGIEMANFDDVVAFPRGIVGGVARRSAITDPIRSPEATS
jgi:hypothetical protein